MPKVAAADWYLSAVCPSNAAAQIADKQFTGIYAEDLDVPKVRATSTSAAAALRTAAEKLDDPPLPWPANVRSSVEKVTAIILSDVTYYQSIARAKTAEAMITASNVPSTAGKNVAAQTARLRLGLPTAGSTRDGCAKWLAANS